MKTLKTVGVTIFVLILLLAVVYQNNKLTTLKKEALSSSSDSLFLQLKNQDSLLFIIDQLEDSLIKAQQDTIFEIKKEYDTNISNINSLTIDEQVNLLTRNLSKDTTNR